jgi:hypothetical protein
MYHPLNGAAGYTIPPIFRLMKEMMGSLYHFKPKAANHGYSG